MWRPNAFAHLFCLPAHIKHGIACRSAWQRRKISGISISNGSSGISKVAAA